MPQNYPNLEFSVPPNPLKRTSFKGLETSHGAVAASSPVPCRQGKAMELDLTSLNHSSSTP